MSIAFFVLALIFGLLAFFTRKENVSLLWFALAIVAFVLAMIFGLYPSALDIWTGG